MVQNGQNDHFGQNDLIPTWILVFARPKWTILVHFGLKRSILVHLGPPTVLWSLLMFSLDFEGRERNFEGRRELAQPPPLRVEDPHPTGQSPEPASSSLCSFWLPDLFSAENDRDSIL